MTRQLGIPVQISVEIDGKKLVCKRYDDYSKHIAEVLDEDDDILFYRQFVDLMSKYIASGKKPNATVLMRQVIDTDEPLPDYVDLDYWTEEWDYKTLDRYLDTVMSME